MKNQFFYTRKEPIKDTNPLEFKEFRDSINVDKVIRTIRINEESLLVLLNDLHERTEEVPRINKKTNRPSFDKQGQPIYDRVRNTFQSEIYLIGDDIERFYKQTNIE